jgi:hypothetical protein
VDFGLDFGLNSGTKESDDLPAAEGGRRRLTASKRAAIVRALVQYDTDYGNDFTVEWPTGSGRQMNLYQVAEEITRRESRLFLRGGEGRRPVYGGSRKFQDDPHWRDLIRFLRVLPRRQRGGPRDEPPDRLDRNHRAGHASDRDHHGGADARVRHEGRGGRGGIDVGARLAART